MNSSDGMINLVSEILDVFLVSASEEVDLNSDPTNDSSVRLFKVWYNDNKSIDCNAYLLSNVYLNSKSTLRTRML